ncbi:sulfurtransferase [Sporosarcina sp. FSL W7-1349]|uniref:sulfurtransferase n=1 Tax=Sporosarcina sp. FSL W7-1349 TaxID=2921561 RepID=UPI0030F90F0E
MSNFVDTAWLKDSLENEDVIILDARYSPTDADYGFSHYIKGHIPNARHVDISAITDEQSDYGGAKPLPYPDQLAGIFGSLGIHEQSTVVIYDDYIKPESARIWWLLKFIGHEKVFVLNGGFAQWKADGYPIVQEETIVQAKEYIPSPRWEIALKKDDIAGVIEQQSAHLIDARNEKVYAGTLGKSGHIPTAGNYFWRRHLNGNQLKLKDDIQVGIQHYKISDSIVHYCGSGISACFNYLLFDEIGYQNIKLYPGSFTDWSASSD